MTTEIRPVRPEEAPNYLRVLPQETGLPIWEPAPAAWHPGEGCWPAPTAPTEQDLTRSAATLLRAGLPPPGSCPPTGAGVCCGR